jgi:RNA polymerase sigma factor (sigma-70 family)
MAKEKAHKSTDKSTSITEAFIKHESFLKRYLSRFLSRSQDIEDVVQDTFLKSYMAEKKHEIRSPKAFLFRVARNAALKELTKKSRQIANYIEDIDAPELISDEVSVEELTAARQKLGMFCQSALEMTPRCRRVFLMAKVYGFSYKEISSQLDISVSTIEKHVAKGLEICNNYMRSLEQSNAQEDVPNGAEAKTADHQDSSVVELFNEKAQERGGT